MKKKFTNYATLDKKEQKRERRKKIIFIILMGIFFLIGFGAILIATWNPDFIATILKRNTVTGIGIGAIGIGATLLGTYLIGKNGQNYEK